MSQQKAEKPYQFVYTDLVGPITPIGFRAKKYFFTFTDDYMHITNNLHFKAKKQMADKSQNLLQPYLDTYRYQVLHTKIAIRLRIKIAKPQS